MYILIYFSITTERLYNYYVNDCNMCARDLPDMPEAHNVYRFRALLVLGQALSSSSLTHTFAELLLYTHSQRFDCGFQLSFQEHVLQMLSITSAQKRQMVSVTNTARFALYKKRVLHCISVLLYSNYCHVSNSL